MEKDRKVEISKKHRAFIDEYFRTGPNRFNATAAYQAVYPKSSYRAARANAARLIADDNITAEIERRMAELHMSADEALSLLADQARGDLGEFMDITSVGYNLDLLNEDGTRKNTRLIKKIKQRTTIFQAKSESAEDREVTETEIELYDAQAAIDKILRVHGKYKDLNLPPNTTIHVTIEGKKDE